MSHVSPRVVALITIAMLATASAFAEKPTARKPKSDPGDFKRVVLLAFKEGTKPERVDELIRGIRALGPKIPAIATLDAGPNTGEKKLSQGFTHVVLLTFRSQEDREAFLANTTHKQYEKEVLDPHLERALVVEFVSPDHRHP